MSNASNAARPTLAGPYGIKGGQKNFSPPRLILNYSPTFRSRPNSPFEYVENGDTYLQKGEWENAQNAFEQASNAFNDQGLSLPNDVCFVMGAVYNLTNDPSRACIYLNMARRGQYENSFDTYWELVVAQRAEGDHAAMEETLAEWMKDYPEKQRPQRLAGIHYYEKALANDPNIDFSSLIKAEKPLAFVINNRPDNTNILNRLKDTYTRLIAYFQDSGRQAEADKRATALAALP